MGNCGVGKLSEDKIDEVMQAEGWSSVEKCSPTNFKSTQFQKKGYSSAETPFCWPNGLIPYEIDHSLDYNWHRIQKAMKTVERYSSFRFIKRSSEEPFLKISKAEGCWFNKGGAGIPRISLGIGCESYGTVLHELLHAIGFQHEHRRPDRDKYITIHWKNIEKGESSQFRRLDPAEYKWSHLPFDYDSIMIYDSYAFSKNGRRTMETKYGNEIPRNENLSEVDKKKLSLL